jgi:predicted dehydrogenase
MLTMDRVCRFAFLSTAAIGRKNWKAIRLSSHARLVGVASREQSAATRFIQECSSEVPQSETPLAFGSYEAALESDLVDAVYIPLPTALRHQWVIRAAEAGKHVIGEKPAAIGLSQAKEMLDACRQHGVQYMDGVMFMHSKRLPVMLELAHSGKCIGEIRRLATQFSFAGGPEFERTNIRTNSGLEPMGCLGDLGWYCIRIIYCLMKEKMPQMVRGLNLFPMRGNNSPDSVPGEFSAELFFDGGVTASFYCSFRTQHQQWLHVSGSQGYLRVDDYVLPFRGSDLTMIAGQDHFMINNCSFHMEHHESRFSVAEYDAGYMSAQEVRMIDAFARQVVSGQVNDAWPRWALDTQRIMEACYESACMDGQPIFC